MAREVGRGFGMGAWSRNTWGLIIHETLLGGSVVEKLARGVF